ELARADVEKYPSVAIERGTVERIDARADSGFDVETDTGRTARAQTLLLAIGVRDELPRADGIERFWGATAFSCPYCDGWEMRERRIGIYGKLGEAVGLAQEMLRWSGDIVLCYCDDATPTDAQQDWLEAAGVLVQRGTLAALEGAGDRLARLRLKDGIAVACEAVFFTSGLVPSCDIAQRVGCALDTEGCKIAVDACQRTNVPGIYAAGDVVTDRHAVSIAGASGARAAMAINDDLVDREAAALVRRHRSQAASSC
ncbi:MAG: NAD(P)/FAD-dependent oxidoreductase, partial [Candidatus Eremiobacteraeota bacterium]|nr:NAD(P)/FAD-dependent oxidoreductase [Candidatus Eremiobacteraeota bacterium]